jgi:hypothetical protein
MDTTRQTDSATRMTASAKENHSMRDDVLSATAKSEGRGETHRPPRLAFIHRAHHRPAAPRMRTHTARGRLDEHRTAPQ